MLKETPIAGQIVRVIEDDHSETTIGCKYKIEDVDDDTGNAWFFNDNEDHVYIDDASVHCYELVEEESNPSVNIGITGIEIDAENYTEFPTRIKLHLVAAMNPNELLKVLDELHEDIAKLLRDKYQR